jgi:hypothetical protein
LDDLAIINQASPPRIINFFNQTIPQPRQQADSALENSGTLVRDRPATSARRPHNSLSGCGR